MNEGILMAFLLTGGPKLYTITGQYTDKQLRVPHSKLHGDNIWEYMLHATYIKTRSSSWLISSTWCNSRGYGSRESVVVAIKLDYCVVLILVLH